MTGWISRASVIAVSITISGSLVASGGDDSRPTGTTAERVAAIVADHDAALKRASDEASRGKTEVEQRKIYFERLPDVAAFSRRLVDLAATDPASPGAREALLWVVDQPGMGPGGLYGDEFQRATILLLRHHADDPEVARVGLRFANYPMAARDQYLEGLYVRAASRETRGFARMALVEYLKAKADHVDGLRKSGDKIETTWKYEERDADGKPTTREVAIPAEVQAYTYHLRQCDPAAIRAEVRRLADEVIRDYGDIRYLTRHHRKLEAALRLPEPAMQGHVFTAEERGQIEKVLAVRRTLADAARAKLDEMDNVAIGQPAPAIDAPTMDGQRRRLADYRGKVVVLVFWGTWCGPCMGEVPHERELAERLRDQPFALLGVDCEEDQEEARRVMARERMTWPNWNDGTPGTGPIADAYHIRSYPSSFVLDARGVIRHIGLRGASLGEAVDALLKEQAAQPGETAK